MLADGFELAPAFLEGINEQQRKMKSVLSPSVTNLAEETPAREVANLMYAGNIKRVPVVRDVQLVGIVARSDLIRALAQKLDEKFAAMAFEKETLNEALQRRRQESGR